MTIDKIGKNWVIDGQNKQCEGFVLNVSGNNKVTIKDCVFPKLLRTLWIDLK